MNRHNIKALILVVLVIFASLIWLGVRSSQTASPANSNQTATPEAPLFDKKANSIDSPDSPWVIVNKKRPLPENYKPADLVAANVKLRLGSDNEEMTLRAEAAQATEAMFAAAGRENLSLMIASAFRSQNYQQNLYNGYVATEGVEAADRSSARPGFSEHQTGWAFDVEPASRQCEIEACFGQLPEGQWVATHAPEFGFIIRYGVGQETLTGYMYEPWHLRYVGQKLASELVKSGQTMEQFFGLEPALSY